MTIVPYTEDRIPAAASRLHNPRTGGKMILVPTLPRNYREGTIGIYEITPDVQI